MLAEQRQQEADMAAGTEAQSSYFEVQIQSRERNLEMMHDFKSSKLAPDVGFPSARYEYALLPLLLKKLFHGLVKSGRKSK